MTWNDNVPQIPEEAFSEECVAEYYRRQNRMNYKDVARLVHTVVREYNVLHKVPGDNYSWYDMDPEYRKSIATAVRREMANPAKTPAASHEKWLKEREDGGWVYGPVKDQAKKEHPCMVPYDDLPEVQKFKDTIFAGMVSLLKDGPPVADTI